MIYLGTGFAPVGWNTRYLWGHDLLVAPVFTPGAATRDVYLPAGDWCDWWTNTRVVGGRTVSRPINLETMPIYVRAGTIVPFDPVRQYTGEKVAELTTLHVYPGADGQFTLYDDDGVSQEYLAGRGQWIRMKWSDPTRELTLVPSTPSGAPGGAVTRVFTVTLPDGTSRAVTYRGVRTTLAF